MADDKTTKTPEQPVTDTGPGKETPTTPPKEPEKVSVSPEPEKKTEPEVKNPQVSVYNFAEIMKEKKAEERAVAPGGEKPDPAKAEKPEKQSEAPKKAEEKPKEPEQPKRRGRPPKADKDKAAAPKPKAPAQKPEKAVKKEPEKKTAPTIQAAPAPKGPEKPKDAPRRGKEQIVYISDTDTTYNFLVALAFSQMFNLLCERADNTYGGRLPYHVRVLWDEAANTGQVPGLEKIVAVIRSREISLTLFYQAMSQCKALYKDHSETIMGNMDSIVFLGGREASTLKDISENWLGKATFSMQTEGRSRGQSESYSQNMQRLGRELIFLPDMQTVKRASPVMY